jgi:protein-ribulosamine 3-kinase
LRVQTTSGPMLLKLNPADRRALYDAEADALAALRAARALAVPAVLAIGTAGGEAYLALQWLEFGAKTPAAAAALGAGLALQHAATASFFGWHRDNYIGTTPQPNHQSADWLSFLRDLRLGYQLDLARQNGLPGSLAVRCAALLRGMERFFDGHEPQPSLLHGDLWGGNWGATAAGVPHVFDPASYYGDREADLAMTRLFGGFGAQFYLAYQRAWPLDEGWEARADLYNLYHLLNHFNIFGAAYAPQVAAVLDRLEGLPSR